MKLLNLLNQKFGRLTVIAHAENIKRDTAWICKCDCGKTKIIKTKYLRGGGSKSCGCLMIDMAKELNKQKKEKRKFEPYISSARRVWSKNYKELSFDDFFKLSQQNCFYCGSEPSNRFNIHKQRASSAITKLNGTFVYNGLDRIDSSKKHSVDNVVPCCKYCNYAKRDQNINDYIKHIEQMYNFIFNNNS